MIVVVDESTVLPAPVGEIYDFVADPRNDPAWWPGVKAVRPVAGCEAAYEQDVVLLGLRQTIRIDVSDAVRPQRVVLKSTSGRLPFVATYRFEELGGRRSRFSMHATVTVTGPYRALGPVFSSLLVRMTRRHLRRLADVVRTRAEIGLRPR